jgi:hypothetical protein
MARIPFCYTLVLACVVAAGCTGQNLEGRWQGPLPYEDATDCRIRMFGSGAFDLVCANDAWIGAGRYDRTGEKLVFRYEALARKDEVVRDPPNLELTYVGRGNTLELRELHSREAFSWHRVMGGQ